MSSGEDIEYLIQQLQELQLQQAALLTRLTQASLGKTNTQRKSNTVVSHDETPELVIGDRVRILNPGVFHTDQGIVTKNGPNWVTIQTSSGAKIIRVQENIIISDE
jgi:hypothetical protein